MLPTHTYEEKAMSTETRLARLGLLHLKDEPEELKAALEKMGKEIDEERASWQRDYLSQPPAEQSEGEVSK
jgi:hypothetical protein